MASQQEGELSSIQNAALERLRILFVTEYFSDVTFVVGRGGDKKEFQAHRGILSATSDVLRAMFYGSLSEGETPIEVPDLHPDGFNAMLRYVYGCPFKFRSIDDAFRTLAVASKYSMDGLKKICCDYLILNVTPGVAFRMYEASFSNFRYGLKHFAVHNFIFNTEAVINDDSFLSAHQNIVQTILRQDTLSVPSELQLFDAVLRWGKANAIKERDPDGDKTVGNIRAVVDPLLPYIRFFSMSAEGFCEGPAQSGVLTDEEVLALVMNINSPGSRPLPLWVSSKFPRKSPRDSISVCTLCILKHHNFELLSSDVHMSFQRKVCVTGKTVVFWGIMLFVSELTKHLNASSGAASVSSSSCLQKSHFLTADFVFSIKNRDYSVREQGTYEVKQNGACRFVLNNPQIICDGETCEIDVQFKNNVRIARCKSEAVEIIGGVSFRSDDPCIHSVLCTVLEWESV